VTCRNRHILLTVCEKRDWVRIDTEPPDSNLQSRPPVESPSAKKLLPFEPITRIVTKKVPGTGAIDIHPGRAMLSYSRFSGIFSAFDQMKRELGKSVSLSRKIC
jgi:hypothetical protein